MARIKRPIKLDPHQAWRLVDNITMWLAHRYEHAHFLRITNDGIVRLDVVDEIRCNDQVVFELLEAERGGIDVARL